MLFGTSSSSSPGGNFSVIFESFAPGSPTDYTVGAGTLLHTITYNTTTFLTAEFYRSITETGLSVVLPAGLLLMMYVSDTGSFWTVTDL